MRSTVSSGWLAAAGTAYVLAPGVPGSLLGGIPIGQTGTVLLVLIIGTWIWTRQSLPRVDARVVAALSLAIVLKAGLSFVPATGWLGRYYANENFAEPFEPSIDFPGLGATRIDPRLSFTETEFPVHFFNNVGYNSGVFREYERAYSVHWRGYVTAGEAVSLPLRLVATGRADLAVDGAPRARVDSRTGEAAADVTVALTPGVHLLEVRYQKPEQTSSQLRLLRADGGALEGVSPSERRLPPMAATAVTILEWGLHAIAAGVVVFAFWPGVRRQRGERWIPVAVVALFVTQGLWKSRHLVDHVWTLSGGDDWLNYEMCARDVVLNGLIMANGGVIGRGQPFSLYPGYAYFVGAVHAVTGESLAGVVLVNFLLLAAATLVAYAIARRLFAPIAALGGLAWLLLIEQLDFVRYYTVTLFSENLYFVLAAATVLFLIDHHQHGRRRDLIAAAVAGALASWTRPSMMLLLPFALASICRVRWRSEGVKSAALDAALFATTWMAVVVPATIRNYVMSGRAVLLTAGQGATFVTYNMPVRDPKYWQDFDGTLFNAGLILLRIFIDHPIASMQLYGGKLGFGLGMVHWLGPGRPHPELVLTSIGYFVAIVMFRPLRTVAAWPLHAFIVTHLATLMLSMPSNYGYRMILPVYVFTSLAAGAVAATWLARVAPLQWLTDSLQPAEAAR